MTKTSVKPRKWNGVKIKGALRLVGKTCWVMRNGEPTKATALFEGNKETLVVYDSEIMGSDYVFKTKTDLLKSIGERILRWKTN